MKTKRNPAQLEKDINVVLGRMGELMSKYSVPFAYQTNHERYGNGTEFGRKWISPQAENTYNNYVRILAKLNEEKMQNGK